MAGSSSDIPPLNEVHTAIEGLEEIDRNARAYGWEVAKHNMLIEIFDHVCEDNPFMDKNWRDNLEEH